MAKRDVKFDLTRPDHFWYKNPEKFWEEFHSTDQIKVPDDFNDWIVGQERARREARLQLEEWVRKLKDINEMRNQGVKVTDVLRERPGPYLLLVGAPGTGKSLIIKSLAAQLERLYGKHEIKLQDVLLVKNKHNRYQPFNRVVPAGMGRRIVEVSVKEQVNKGRRRGRILYALILSMVFFGLALIGSGLFQLAMVMGRVGLAQGWFGGAPPILQAWLGIGAIFTIFPLFFLFGGRAFGLNIGTATSKELLDTPNLLVDNGPGRKLYVNATVSNSGRMFGDIEWCNTGETLVADAAGRLHRIAASEYGDVLGNARNPVLVRHSFIKEVIAIRTRSGRVLRGNPSHPVMTRSGWRQLQDIATGMEVRVATQLPMPTDDAPLKWQKTFSAYHGRNVSRLEVACTERADERLAALAGWLVAEGWVTYRNGRPIALHAEVPKAEGHLVDLASRAVREVFGVKPNILTVSHLSGFTPSEEMIRSSICSVDIASWLGEDVAMKRVPDWVLGSGEAVSSAFLRWLFEGDGCVANDTLGRVGVVLSQKNVQLLRDVQVMLLRYGIQSAIYRRKGREEHSLWIRRARDLRIFHDRIGFVSPGKSRKLGVVVRHLPKRTIMPSPWEAVAEVRREAPERVYGFMLGGDQSYWSNGILSHNSPYGDHPGLAAPPHKRVVAGEVHQAHMKILYIDEFRNLDEKSAVELLTVMEDGVMPIKGHQGFGGTHTASQNVATDPVDAMFFLVAGANLDAIQDPTSVLNRVPALRDRFNYGNIVLMDTEMDATAENQIKVAQAIADEVYRFNLPPMEKAGVREVIDYMRRKASSNRRMRIMFRSVIKILKKGAQLCWTEGDTMIRAKHVRVAIEDFAKPIEQQMLEQQVESQRPYRLISTEGAKVGTVNGLVVFQDTVSKESAGDVATVAVWMRKVEDAAKADFVVTGINEENNTWIADSKRAVRTAIMRMYGIDLQKETYTHVTFLQSRGVDGPCLLPGSRVWYNSRPEEVKVGHRAIVGGKGRSQKIVSEEWRPYSGDAYAVKPRYLQEMRVTPNHPFYVARLRKTPPGLHAKVKVQSEGWLKARDMQPGDYLVIPKNITAGLDKPREILLHPGKLWRNGIGRTKIPVDEKMATFVGWYVAEGHSKADGEVTLTLNIEKDPVAQLEELIRSIGYSVFRQNPRGKAINLSFRSRMLGRWLRENVGTRATNKRIPEVIFDSPRDIRLAFLRAYISGDGFVGRRYVGMKTASKDLWYDLTYLLVGLGIIPSTSHEGATTHLFGGRPIRGRGSYIVNVYGNQRKAIVGEIEKKRWGASQFIEQPDRFLLPVDDVKRFQYEGPIYNVETEDGTYLMPVKTHNSAGITMTLAIMSHLGDPRLPPDKRAPIPLRQDVAVTGAIEIIGGGQGEVAGDVVVSSVGSIADKVRGASLWGIKYVVIPMENWEHSLDESDRRNLGITIVGCRTVLDYLTWTRADGKRKEDDVAAP